MAGYLLATVQLKENYGIIGDKDMYYYAVRFPVGPTLFEKWGRAASLESGKSKCERLFRKLIKDVTPEKKSCGLRFKKKKKYHRKEST